MHSKHTLMCDIFGRVKGKEEIRKWEIRQITNSLHEVLGETKDFFQEEEKWMNVAQLCFRIGIIDEEGEKKQFLNAATTIDWS